MKKFLLPLLLLTGLWAKSQTYNNEWINYSRTYHKFKIAVTGLYRINQPLLASIGLGSTPAEQFQLWKNGQQIPVYTSVQTGPMSASDYIEFWGEMNDGKPDLDLYKLPDYQLNEKWSLESDTAIFFLTVNPAANHLRLLQANNNLPSAIPVEPYFMHTAGKYYRDKFNLGYAAIVGDAIYSSVYDQGEGFTSSDIGTGATLSFSFTNLNVYTTPGAPAPVLKVNAAGSALNPRQFEILVNSSQVGVETMDYFEYKKVTAAVGVSLISGGSANVGIKNNCVTGGDRMVVAKLELTYPRQFNFGGTDNFSFELPANASGNYLEIAGFTYGSANPVLYDLTNGKRYVGDITNPALVRVLLEPSSVPRKLLLVSQATSFPIAVTSLQQRNFTNYGVAGSQGDYLIITHPALTNGPSGTNPVEDYRMYRSSAVGGGNTAKIYMIDQIIDQFGFGIKQSPLSVRNFIRWARNTYTSPVKNVFLIGKGLHYIQNRNNQSHPDIDKLSFIPTFGHPASDNLLAADPGLAEIPKVPIGRLSVINAAEISPYLAKVIQYEQAQAFSSPLIQDKAWMKNVMHTVGAGDGAHHSARR